MELEEMTNSQRKLGSLITWAEAWLPLYWGFEGNAVIGRLDHTWLCSDLSLGSAHILHIIPGSTQEIIHNAGGWTGVGWTQSKCFNSYPISQDPLLLIWRSKLKDTFDLACLLLSQKLTAWFYFWIDPQSKTTAVVDHWVIPTSLYMRKLWPTFQTRLGVFREVWS